MTFQRRYFLDKHKENQHGITAANTGYSGSEPMGHQIGYDNDQEANHQGDEDDEDDDDADSDPLKLEIDETPMRTDDNGQQDFYPVKVEVELA